MENQFYIIDKNVLPAIFEKVLEAKKLVQSGKCKTVHEAARAVGISRAVYYKYKDHISIFVEKNAQNIITINLRLMDEVGVLANVLKQLSDSGASVLTINQNIPTDGIAPVSISLTTESLSVSLEELMFFLRNIEGVLNVDVIAKE